jgi:septal ring factor EnvC (AmiA/AmiB activator)
MKIADYFQLVPTGSPGAIHHDGQSYRLLPDNAPALMGFIAAADDEHEQIEDLKEEIESLKDEARENDATINELRKEKDTLEAKLASVEARLEAIKGHLAVDNKWIDSVRDSIIKNITEEVAE